MKEYRRVLLFKLVLTHTNRIVKYKYSYYNVVGFLLLLCILTRNFIFTFPLRTSGLK